MESMGIGSIEPHEGMALLETFVGSGMDQMAVIKMIGGQAIPYVSFSESSAQQPRNPQPAVILEHNPSPLVVALPPTAEKLVADTEECLHEKSIAYFQTLIASTLKMRPEQIETRRPLSDYGLDSILVGQLTFKLRKVFPGVTGTLLFEVKNIDGLVDYFVKNKKQELTAVVSPAPATPQPAMQPLAAVSKQTSPTLEHPKAASVSTMRVRRSGGSSSANVIAQEETSAGALLPQRNFSAASGTAASRPIVDVAVIGLSGRYPRSNNLKELWVNLLNGVNCITEIPRDRWKWEEYYDPERGKSGKIYTRWGGFVEGIDQFDPFIPTAVGRNHEVPQGEKQ